MTPTVVEHSSMISDSVRPVSASDDVGVGEMELDVDVDVEWWNAVVMVEVWNVEGRGWGWVGKSEDNEEDIVVAVLVVSAKGGTR